MTRDPISEAHRQWVAHGWADAADGMAMVTSVVRAQQLLMERIDAVLRPRGLTFARYEVLRLLSFSRGAAMPMSRLGSLLQVHPTSVTSAVDRLVAQGYVERVRSDEDKRVVRAVLTDAGRDAVEEATHALNREVFETPGLPEGDVRELTDRLTPADGLGDSSGTRPELPLAAEIGCKCEVPGYPGIRERAGDSRVLVGSPTIDSWPTSTPPRTRSASSRRPRCSTATTPRSTSCGGSS